MIFAFQLEAARRHLAVLSLESRIDRVDSQGILAFEVEQSDAEPRVQTRGLILQADFSLHTGFG